MKTIIYSIVNEKSLVGKTTTAINLSSSLAIKNKKVLLIDADPKSNTTKNLLHFENNHEFDISHIFLQEKDINDTIISNIYKFDLIPSSLNLVKANLKLSNIDNRNEVFKAYINKLRGKYDYIIIDCAPGTGFLNKNMIIASDKILVPIRTDVFALDNINDLLSKIRHYQKKYSHSLRIDGFLITMYDKKYSGSLELKNNIKLYFKEKLYKTIIPKDNEVINSQNNKSPIFYFNQKNIVSLAYRKLANEIIKLNKDR